MAANALTFQVPVEALASSTGRGTPQPAAARFRANVSFPRTALMGSLWRKEGRGVGPHHLCRAEGEGGSCCGGESSSSASGGKCSSHGSSSKSDVAGIGKEFEALVAQKTMQEFEQEYEIGQMEGTISRDVISDVVNIYPDAVVTKNQEMFLDIDELLAEARSLSGSGADFVFDADFEEMLV